MLSSTCADPATTPAPVDTPPPIQAAGQAVLLVEDSRAQRRVVERILNLAGYTNVVLADDGVHALELIARTNPVAVLTDLYMPRMDGLALVEQIRERHPQIPVVLMTGAGTERTAVAALKAGAADYVPKSQLKEELADVLDRIIAAARVQTDKLRLLKGLTGRVTRLAIENDPGLVSPLIAQFRDELIAIGVCDTNDATRVGIALEEALLNAIYHGNLEISSKLKENGDGPFHALARQRRTEPRHAARRVSVSARITPERAVYRIADEGPGFDVSSLPDPTDLEFLERPSGRGLLLMRAFMDDVRYNASGNQVTLVKNRA
jgi:CheY-like chemotaxis protein/anti-sigma regulatory factor (Ser/Thr protein kinase)